MNRGIDEDRYYHIQINITRDDKIEEKKEEKLDLSSIKIIESWVIKSINE